MAEKLDLAAIGKALLPCIPCLTEALKVYAKSTDATWDDKLFEMLDKLADSAIKLDQPPIEP